MFDDDARAMRVAAPVDELEAAELVALLADQHRYFPAYQRLLTMGTEASEASRRGLRHPDPTVRMRCCQVLDHVMDEAGLDALLPVLDDPAPEVRVQALHALACDRCKQDACRPNPARVLPRAVPMLAGDPHPRVRAGAAEVVGVWVHSNPDAVAALVRAAREDPSPAVRKKARWYTPGGSIYERSRPRR
jgi:HEAT repeat protein